MTLGAWLHERMAGAPPRLAARLEEILTPSLALDRSKATEALIDAAVDLLGQLLHSDSTGRDSALDLLAVDALVTYAFEAAGDEPTTLDARAGDAARRLAAAAAA